MKKCSKCKTWKRNNEFCKKRYWIFKKEFKMAA